MPNFPWISYNVNDAVYYALKSQTEYFAYPQVTYLATRITSDTPGAIQCPNYDPVRETEMVPDDPTCLGVGWIVTDYADFLPDIGNVSATIQRGYLTPVWFDVVIVPGEIKEEDRQEGVVEYQDQTIAYWPPRQTVPKKGDVFIVTVPSEPRNVYQSFIPGGGMSVYQHSDRTYRYVIADVETPSVLGSQTLLYRATLEARQPDSIVYAIPSPTADVSGFVPGTWS